MKYLLFILLFSCTNDFNSNEYIAKTVVYDGFQYQILTELNNVRKLNGLDTLIGEEEVTFGAKNHAIEMKDSESLNHNGFQKRFDDSRAIHFSEVVNKNMVTAKSYINSFLSSPSHKEAILDKNKTHCGIYAYENYLCIDLAEYKKN